MVAGINYPANIMANTAYNEALEQLRQDEGFRGNPYKCPTGHLTVGYGTTFPLTEEEADIILQLRLSRMMIRLEDLLRQGDEPIVLSGLPDHVHYALANMVYQLGVAGILKFKKMFAAIAKGDYDLASREALDSLWAKQTPARARRVAKQIRGNG